MPIRTPPRSTASARGDDESPSRSLPPRLSTSTSRRFKFAMTGTVLVCCFAVSMIGNNQNLATSGVSMKRISSFYKELEFGAALPDAGDVIGAVVDFASGAAAADSISSSGGSEEEAPVTTAAAANGTVVVPPPAEDERDNGRRGGRRRRKKRRSNTFDSSQGVSPTMAAANGTVVPPPAEDERDNGRRGGRRRRKQERRPRDGPAFNFTNFLIHIPKTGGEYAMRSINLLMRATIQYPSTKTKMDGAAVEALMESDDDDDLPPYFCNQATMPIHLMKPYYYPNARRDPTSKLKLKCVGWMTEKPYDPRASNAYTFVRSPVSHVFSQYHHCTESIPHLKRGLEDQMPSDITVWLKAFENLTDWADEQTAEPSKIETRLEAMGHNVSRKQFECYNPINSQTQFTRFARQSNGPDYNIPDGYVYPYPYHDDDDGNDKAPAAALDRTLFNDLKSRFAVIGDTARMTKTVCAIFVHMTDGKPRIPLPCDCTNGGGGGDEYTVPQSGGETTENNNNATKLYQLPNLYYVKRGKDRFSNVGVTKIFYRPYLEIGYDPSKHSHGVKHHGSGGARNVTGEQLRLIRKLRWKDNILYNVSRHVFDVQIAELERKHSFRICDEWFSVLP